MKKERMIDKLKINGYISFDSLWMKHALFNG